MAAITLTTLIDRVRQVGEYSNAKTITSAMITAEINEAIGEYSDLLDERWEGYRDTVGTAVTVAGTATVSLPAGFLKMRALDVLDGGMFHPLTPFAIRQTYGYDLAQDRPEGFLLRGSVIELFPTPNAVYSLRLRYVPQMTALVNLSDSIDVPNGWEGFIVHTALLKLDEREERPIGERLAIIDRYRQRITAAAENRQAAEPEYLVMPVGAIGGVP